MLYKEYNLNLIDLNKLLSDKIELNISNFIYDNNLTLSLSSRDFNYICKHYFLSEILDSLQENYNNIIQNNFMVSPTSSINYYLNKRCQG